MLLDKNDVPCKGLEIVFDYCPKCGEQIKVSKIDNTQQLQAKISDLVKEHSSLAAVSSQSYLNLVNELRQLSAVQ